MEQRNIAHLKHAGRFKIIQRKNNASNKVDIYCQFVTTMEENRKELQWLNKTVGT